MDTDDRFTKNQSIPAFSTASLKQPRHVPKFDFNSIDPFNPQLEEISKKVQSNNQKIAQSIGSQKNLLQPLKNFCLPTVSNFISIDAIHTQRSHFVGTPKKQDSSSHFQFKKNEITNAQNINRIPIALSPKEEYTKAKIQLEEIRHYLSQPNSRIVSPRHSPTPRDGDTDRIPEDLALLEKGLRARLKLDTDKSRTQSKFMNKRDTSYIIDALANGPLSVRQSYREISPTSSREIISPNASQTNIDSSAHKLTHSKSTFGASFLNHPLPILNSKGKNSIDIEGPYIDSCRLTPKLEDQKISQHPKSEIETCTLISLNPCQNQKFTEHFAQNFNTGQLDKVSSGNYQVKKSFRLQRASSMSYTENPVIPKLGQFSPFKPHKPKQTENESLEENELIVSLRKECPNIFTPVPPGRQDVLTLSTWVQDKINNVVASNLEENEKCIKCDEIYNLGLNELIRQVSLECVERGELLCQIWTSYYQVLLQYKSNVALDFEKEKIAYTRNLKEQNDHFQALYQEKDQELEHLKQQRKESQDEINKSNLRYDNLLEKDMKHKNKIDQLRRVISHFKAQIEDLKHENRTLTRRQIKESEMKKDKKDKKDNKTKTQNENIVAEASEVHEDSKYRLNESSTLNVSRTKSDHIDENENSQSKEKRDSETSTESDDEFAFIDEETNQKIKYNFDQLNNNLVAFRPSRLENKDAQKFKEIDKEDKDTQTVISLVSEKYNEVFVNQFCVDELVIEKILKNQVDNFAQNTEKLLLEIEEEQQILQQKLREKWSSSELKEQLGSINIPEPVFKSIYNLNDQSTAEKPAEKQQFLNAQNNESFSTPKANHSEPLTISLNYTNIKEDEVKVGTPRTPRGSILKKARVGGSVRSLSITRDTVDQKQEKQPDGAIEKQIESPKFIKTVRIAEDKPEEMKKEENNISKDASTEVNEEKIEINDQAQSQEVDEYSQPIMSPYMRKQTKAFTVGTPSRFNPEASLNAAMRLAEIAANQTNTESNEPESQTSVESENKNLDEHKKLSIRIDSEANPVHFKSEARDSLTLPRQPRRPRLSFGIDLSDPRNGNPNQEITKSDDAFSEKARLILLARMYKVETDKTKGMQSDIETLNAQIGAEQENVIELEANIKELKIKVRKLERLKDQCIHKVCPICGDQSPVDDDTKLNFDQEGFNDEINEDDNNTTRGRAITEGVEEDNEDDASDGGSTRRMKKEKSFKKRNVKQTTTATSPEFKNKKVKEQKVNPSAAIIATIKESGMKKFKNFMPLKSVLKHIFTLYNDRLKDNAIYKDEEFPNFVYTWFLNNFGFKKIAEQKFIVFVLSVKKYLYVVRINLFARFMGLLDGISNHNLEEFTRYIEATEYISKLNLGSPVQNADTDTKHYIPFLKGADYVKYFAETKMGIDEYAEFRKGIESIKESDPKGINRNGLIDFDLLMTKVLAKYRIVCSRAKQNVVTAFKAADLDGNKNCSLKEFNILYRNIEAEKYDFSFAEAIFNQHADINVGGQMNLSFDKFTVVCVEYSLFSDPQQDTFLGVQTKEELATQMQELQQKWEQTFESIQENLKIMTSIPKEEIEYWQSILELLGSRISSIDDCTSQETKPLLIAYKILFQETEKLREQDMGVDAYGVKKQKQTSKLNL